MRRRRRTGDGNRFPVSPGVPWRFLLFACCGRRTERMSSARWTHSESRISLSLKVHFQLSLPLLTLPNRGVKAF